MASMQKPKETWKNLIVDCIRIRKTVTALLTTWLLSLALFNCKACIAGIKWSREGGRVGMEFAFPTPSLHVSATQASTVER